MKLFQTGNIEVVMQACSTYVWFCAT